MGIYVYALNTKVRTISNVTVGVAEFRYKMHVTAADADRVNARLYSRTCARRVEHFKRSKLPFFFVMGELAEGGDVFGHLTADNRLVGACFDDGIGLKKVGTIRKAGRAYEIEWI